MARVTTDVLADVFLLLNGLFFHTRLICLRTSLDLMRLSTTRKSQT